MLPVTVSTVPGTIRPASRSPTSRAMEPVPPSCAFATFTVMVASPP